MLVIGVLLSGLGAAMMLPMLADLIAGSKDWRAFATGGGLSMFLGGGLALANWGHGKRLTVRTAFLLVSLTWVLLAAFGAIPFVISDLGLSVTDAFFESTSGLTTTGATILTGLDDMPPGVLLWRSILQWMGGIGIIVTALAVLPMLRVGGMQLFRLESSDKSEKILPRATQIAAFIGGIYIALTMACAISYWATGMSLFDAVCHAMTTIATGGFSTSDRSMGAFMTGGADIVGTIFMFAGGVPFVLYMMAARGRPDAFLTDSQVRVYLGIFLTVTLILTFYLWLAEIHQPVRGVRLAAFNAVSIMTGTGYATADYALWGGFANAFFFCLMFIGGCAGSTSCSIKIFRYQIAFLALKTYVLEMARPNVVARLKYNGRVVPEDTIFSVLSFFFLFFLCFAALAIFLSAIGLDLVTALSGAATSVANVGPGLGTIIGPAGTFQPLPDAAKWAMAAGMFVGRLEVVTVLVLLSPAYWRG
ncbi:MAG: TrkH family potassium uptake protein [Euryhalocaulis sp.]|nr:TrkH family potassium uptake protein [Euryhalocaulis sp.]